MIEEASRLELLVDEFGETMKKKAEELMEIIDKQTKSEDGDVDEQIIIECNKWMFVMRSTIENFQ